MAFYVGICLAIVASSAAAIAAPAPAENPWKKRFKAQPAVALERQEEPLELAPVDADNVYSITFKEVQDAVSAKLVSQGAGDFVRALMPRREDSAAMSYREPLHLQIDQLNFDEETKAWDAVAFFSVGSKTLAPMKITGRYDLMAEVPVLKDRVSNGQLITAENIEMKAFSTTRLREHTLGSPNDLVGKMPKHSISALRPIRADEIITPPIVYKGESVNVAYKTASMEISTVGQAMEDGATGDLIKIRNPDSNTVIQATITGKGMAQIQPANHNTTGVTQ